jgi:hypothetical protein
MDLKMFVTMRIVITVFHLNYHINCLFLAAKVCAYMAGAKMRNCLIIYIYNNSLIWRETKSVWHLNLVQQRYDVKRLIGKIL